MNKTLRHLSAATYMKGNEMDEKIINEAMENRFDGVESCVLVEELLELEAENKLLRTSFKLLKQVMELIEKGVLVRNTAKDNEPDWAMKQLPLIVLLKEIEQALKEK